MRFSIRDVVLVTLIVALVVGWWIDHWHQASRLKEQDVWLKTWSTIVDEAFPPLQRGGMRFPLPRGDY